MLASMKEMIIETSNKVNEQFVHLLEAKDIYCTGDNIYSPIKTYQEQQEEAASEPQKINEF